MMTAVDINSTIVKKRFVELALTEANVTDAFFIMSRNRAVLTVEFITDTGKIGKTEHWMVKGDTLRRALNDIPVGVNLLGALGRGLNDIVGRVENTEGLKDDLIESGELKLYSSAEVSVTK